MTSGNRVEELEKKVTHLEATVQGLTEEFVEANERIKQIEAALGGDADDSPKTDEWDDITGADPEEVERAAAEADKSHEGEGGDEGERDDIIVA